jgi:hypothetical protein
MPTPTLVLDSVEDAQIDRDHGRYKVVRGGWVYGLDTTLPQPEILASALSATGMPADGSAFPATALARAILVRIVVSAIRGRKTKARVLLFYEQPTFNTVTEGASVFILERNRSSVWVEAQLHPKDKKPMRFKWANPRDANDKRPEANATIRHLKPILTLTASGYIIGSPPTAYESAYKKVNNATWNGYPKAYWLYMGAFDRTDDNGTSYSIRLEFLNNVDEDWSQYEVYRDPNTGLLLPVADAHVAELKALPYAYGFDTRNGIIKTGMYDLANFTTAFGFGS